MTDTRKRSATAIRFDPELHTRLTRAAAERELSVNYLVNRAVTEFLDHLIPLAELQWTRYPSVTDQP